MMKNYAFYFILVLPLLLISSCERGLSSSEGETYNGFIKERHQLLGQMLILQGRLLEAFIVNENVLDDGQFIDAEELLAERLISLGTKREIDSLSLPSSLASSPAVLSLHKRFGECVYYLRESARIVDEEAYVPRAVSFAEASWDEARICFIEFTENLLRATGEDEKIKQGDAKDIIPPMGFREGARARE